MVLVVILVVISGSVKLMQISIRSFVCSYIYSRMPIQSSRACYRGINSLLDLPGALDSHFIPSLSLPFSPSPPMPIL